MKTSLERFDLKNFLSFHSKKGLEEHNNIDNLVSLKTDTVENMKSRDSPLLITVKDQKGIMMVIPNNILSKVLFSTDKVYGTGTKYGLLKIKWKPQEIEELLILDKLYTIRKSLTNKIDTEIFKTLFNIDSI